MIKGLPRLFIERNGAVITTYEFIVDDDFEQKERTLRKNIYKLSINIKEKSRKFVSPLKKMNAKTAWPLSKQERCVKDHYKIYSLKEEAHDVPPFKFIRQVDREAKINPDYFC